MNQNILMILCIIAVVVLVWCLCTKSRTEKLNNPKMITFPANSIHVKNASDNPLKVVRSPTDKVVEGDALMLAPGEIQAFSQALTVPAPDPLPALQLIFIQGSDCSIKNSVYLMDPTVKMYTYQTGGIVLEGPSQ